MIIRTIDYIYENLINNNSKRHCCSIAAATADAVAVVVVVFALAVAILRVFACVLTRGLIDK